MNGYFDSGRPTLEFEIKGLKTDRIKATIDTGYDGYLSIPLAKALPLGLILIATKTYTLADGNSTHNLVCMGDVKLTKYKGQFIPIDLSFTSNSILVGCAFFKVFKVKVHIDYSNEKVRIINSKSK